MVQRARIIQSARRQMSGIVRRLRAKHTDRSPATSAPVRRDPAAVGPDAWRLTDLTRDGLRWGVAVQVPADHGIEAAALILVGRTSQHEVAIRVTLTDRTASTTLAESVLAGFEAETLDAWIDTVDLEGTSARQRVSVARTIDSARLAAVSAPGARWYATVNANLSVEVKQPIAGAVSSGPPEVTEAGVEGDDTSRLVITGVVTADPTLQLVGRRTRTEAELVLSQQPSGWSVSVAEEDLAVFGVETVDLFVAGSAVEGGRSRRRLMMAGGVGLTALAGGLRRWYVTPEGGVSVRRQTPVEAIVEAGVFDEEFYRAQVPDLPGGVDPIEHYVSKGAALDLDPSSMFETAYYRRMNRSTRRVNPLAHYCEVGWKELRNPSPRFNTWWYWSKHLDPAVDDTPPLAHYQAVGRFEGLSTCPDPLPSRSFGPGQRFDVGRSVRRVCLFAGYDRDGIVDDYVVDYVRELSRFADVYYLADGEMAASELAKLADITKGAWG
ncbi:MAG TPA: hypothetical protein VIT42_04825, partial [Microlunatus sp.]